MKQINIEWLSIDPVRIQGKFGEFKPALSCEISYKGLKRYKPYTLTLTVTNSKVFENFADEPKKTLLTCKTFSPLTSDGKIQLTMHNFKLEAGESNLIADLNTGAHSCLVVNKMIATTKMQIMPI